MVFRKLKIILFICALTALLAGCEKSTTNITLKDQTKEYSTEVLWKSNSIDHVSDIDVEGNLLYLMNEENDIDVVDMENGEVIKSVNVGIEDSTHAPQLSVYGDCIAINYKDYALVYDLSTEHVVNKISPAGVKKANIYSVELYKDYIMLWSYKTEKLHCFNFKTNEEMWTMGGDRGEYGIMTIAKVEEKYITQTTKMENNFISIDPLTGKIIDAYEYERIGNLDDRHKETWRYKMLDEDLDENLEYALTKRSLNAFRMDNQWTIYSIGKDILTVFSDDNNIAWTVQFESEIEEAEDIGNYVLIDFEDGGFIVVNLKTQSIVHKEDFILGERSFVTEYKDTYVLIGDKGILKALKTEPKAE